MRSPIELAVNSRILFGVAVGFCWHCADAHHGIANFNLNEDIELTGVISRVEFINPHSWLYVDVTDASGAVTAWRCELRGATVLRRSGWSEEMFPAGSQIRISGSPDRRDPTTCYLGTAHFADGSSVDRYGQIQAAPVVRVAATRDARRPNGDPNFAGDWAAEQRVMTDPRGQSGTLVPISVADQFTPGGVPEGGQAFPGSRGTAISLTDDPVDTYWNRRPSALPLTAAGEAAMADFDGSSTDNPRLRCEPTNILFDWTFEMDVNRISQSDTQVRLQYGSMGLDRTIHLDMDAHPQDIAPTRAGHSIGHWRDDVLIVDTVGFLPGVLSADGRLPHSAQLHVVERFELNADAGVLSRQYEAEDPSFFEGTYRGADTVQISDLAYSGTSVCEDRTYRDGAEPGAADSADMPTLENRDEAAAPWWMIWKWW